MASLSAPGQRPCVVQFRTSPCVITLASTAVSWGLCFFYFSIEVCDLWAALKRTHRGSLVMWACCCDHKADHGTEGFYPSPRGKSVYPDKVLRRVVFTSVKMRQRIFFLPLNVSASNLGPGKGGASLFPFFLAIYLQLCFLAVCRKSEANPSNQHNCEWPLPLSK